MSHQRIDRDIGSKLRSLRRLRGMTQHQLGSRLGVSFQQVQKYEQGMSRMTVARLCQLSEVFQVPLHAWVGSGEPDAPQEGAAPGDRMLLKLIASYRLIPSPKKRALLCAVAREFAGDGPSDFAI